MHSTLCLQAAAPVSVAVASVHACGLLRRHGLFTVAGAVPLLIGIVKDGSSAVQSAVVALEKLCSHSAGKFTIFTTDKAADMATACVARSCSTAC